MRLRNFRRHSTREIFPRRFSVSAFHEAPFARHLPGRQVGPVKTVSTRLADGGFADNHDGDDGFAAVRVPAGHAEDDAFTNCRMRGQNVLDAGGKILRPAMLI